MRRVVVIVVAVAVVAAAGFAGWMVLGRDPMAFAGGSTAPLGTDTEGVTGVPAQLAQADLVARGA